MLMHGETQNTECNFSRFRIRSEKEEERSGGEKKKERGSRRRKIQKVVE